MEMKCMRDLKHYVYLIVINLGLLLGSLFTLVVVYVDGTEKPSPAGLVVAVAMIVATLVSTAKLLCTYKPGDDAYVLGANDGSSGTDNDKSSPSIPPMGVDGDGDSADAQLLRTYTEGGGVECKSGSPGVCDAVVPGLASFKTPSAAEEKTHVQNDDNELTGVCVHMCVCACRGFVCFFFTHLLIHPPLRPPLQTHPTHTQTHTSQCASTKTE
jgi:hypothetical protein